MPIEAGSVPFQSRLVSLTYCRIYTLEKQIHNPTGASQDAENSPLLVGQQLDPDTTFKRMLDGELEKVCSFYQLKELEIYGEVDALVQDEQEYEADRERIDMDAVTEDVQRRPGRAGSVFDKIGFKKLRRTTTNSLDAEDPRIDEYSDDEDADEDQPLNKSRSSIPKYKGRTSDMGNGNGNGAASTTSRDDMGASTHLAPSSRRRASVATSDQDTNMQFSMLYDSGVTLKKRTVSLYVSLCELKSFIELNFTGFKKVLKKYDKVCDRDLRKSYLDKHVSPSYPFRESTIKHLDTNIAKIEKTYADVVTQGDVKLARRELRLHLREHVVWERNTVWREMIGIERKAQAANFGIRQTLLGGDDPSKARLQGDASQDEDTKEFNTPVGRYRCPAWLFSSTFFLLVFIIAIFVVLLLVPIMDRPEQQNCLAMLIFVSLLWATEVIPLFVTSLLVPFFVVILQIMRQDEPPYRRLSSKDATKAVFSAMWTPVIMLLLGGFTIAAALSKFHLAKMMATFVLSKAGTRPRTVLVTNMFVAMFLSMWISNVAAPVLCFSIIQVSRRRCRPLSNHISC